MTFPIQPSPSTYYYVLAHLLITLAVYRALSNYAAPPIPPSPLRTLATPSILLMGHGHLADTRSHMPVQRAYNRCEVVGMSAVGGRTITPYDGFVLSRVCKEKEGAVRDVTLFFNSACVIVVNCARWSKACVRIRTKTSNKRSFPEIFDRTARISGFKLKRKVTNHAHLDLKAAV